jgi:cell division protein FtsB
MMVENMAVQELYILALTLTSRERLKAAGSFGKDTSSDVLFTVLAIVGLITAVALLFWLFRKYKRTERSLNQKIADLTIENAKLRQENTELKANNEQLQEENAGLHKDNTELYKKVEVLENIITTNEENPPVKQATS